MLQLPWYSLCAFPILTLMPPNEPHQGIALGIPWHRAKVPNTGTKARVQEPCLLDTSGFEVENVMSLLAKNNHNNPLPFLATSITSTHSLYKIYSCDQKGQFSDEFLNFPVRGLRYSDGGTVAPFTPLVRLDHMVHCNNHMAFEMKIVFKMILKILKY